MLLPLISISLRVRGFRATQSSLQKHFSPQPLAGREPTVETLQPSRVELTARMVRSAAYRTFPGATCLERSLTLWWLLARQGIVASIRIGTHKSGDKIEAHAWVEHAGVALNEPEDPHTHYAVFDEAFPQASETKK
jgi:hypothetical protein